MDSKQKKIHLKVLAWTAFENYERTEGLAPLILATISIDIMIDAQIKCTFSTFIFCTFSISLLFRSLLLSGPFYLCF